MTSTPGVRRATSKGANNSSASSTEDEKRRRAREGKRRDDELEEAEKRNPRRPSESMYDWSEGNAPLVSPTAEDLLKQRFLHAQKRSPGTLMTGGSGSESDVSVFFRERKQTQDAPKEKSTASSSSSQKPEDTSLMGTAHTADDTPRKEESPSDAEIWSKEGSFADTTVVPFPAFPTASLMPIQRHRQKSIPDQPFDTHAFVRRLEQGGWKRGDFGKTNQAPTRDGVPSVAAARHDPAEALMELIRGLLKHRGEELSEAHIDRSDLDNQLYLFSSALAELRTEVRVRARNDAAALRSLSSLLQREVDGLTQRLQADIERLKHDIQVDMNHRKTEVNDENNALEQEIQDLNNRFTIFLSDLRTEIEQSIKWDATRRALALVFGIVAILVCTLALADYFERKHAADAKSAVKDAKTSGEERQGAASMPLGHGSAEDSPRSAEEYGLLPRYESDEARYV